MSDIVNNKSENKEKFFPSRLLECRQWLGLSQREFAEKVGVSLRTVQLWEGGLNLPQPRKMRKISEVTGASIAWLRGGEHGGVPVSAPVFVPTGGGGGEAARRTAGEFGRYLLTALRRKEMSPVQLARRIHAEAGMVERWLAGAERPGPDLLGKLARVLGVSPEYFAGGDLHIHVNAEDMQVRKAFWGAGDDRHEPVPAKERHSHRVPVVSWARAGEGGNFGDGAHPISEWLDINCPDPNAYALILEGDSMVPEFKPADRVICMPNTTAQNGDVVVAQVARSGDVLFKICHLTGPQSQAVCLTSYNPAYPPLEYRREEFSFIHPVHSLFRVRQR